MFLKVKNAVLSMWLLYKDSKKRVKLLFLFIIIFDYFKKYPQKYPHFFLLPPKKHFLAKNTRLQNSFVMVAVVIAN